MEIKIKSAENFEFIIRDGKCYLIIYVEDLQNIYRDFKRAIKRVPFKYVENGDYYVLRSGDKSIVLEREVVLDSIPPFPVNEDHLIGRARKRLEDYKLLEETVMKNSFLLYKIPRYRVTEITDGDEDLFLSTLSKINLTRYTSVYLVSETDYVRLNPFKLLMEIKKREKSKTEIIKKLKERDPDALRDYAYLDIYGTVLTIALITRDREEMVVILPEVTPKIQRALDKIREDLEVEKVTVIQAKGDYHEISNGS